MTKFGQFWLYFMNLNHVLKKVGRGRSHNLFSFKVFLNLHGLGYPKSVTIFWVQHDLSMMCMLRVVVQIERESRSAQSFLSVLLLLCNGVASILLLKSNQFYEKGFSQNNSFITTS
jgi:hypothetical protein